MASVSKAQWPSERTNRAPKVPLFHRRKRINRDVVWGHDFSHEIDRKDGRQIAPGEIVLLSEIEARQIREMEKRPNAAFWLDSDQQAVTSTLRDIERRVEAYCHPGIPERSDGGRPNGYMIEQEKHVQILVAREIRDGKVVAEWEEDFEEVPLWHFIEIGCLGSSGWRSKFAQYIPPR